MAEIAMTDEQREEFREHSIDQHSLEKTLEVSLLAHTNQINLLRKREEVSWQKAAEMHGFDTQSRWYADYKRGVFTQELTENNRT